MRRKRVKQSGDEYDAFSRYWRPLFYWKRGQLKKIKQRANRRERRTKRKDIAEGLN